MYVGVMEKEEGCEEVIRLVDTEGEGEGDRIPYTKTHVFSIDFVISNSG